MIAIQPDKPVVGIPPVWAPLPSAGNYANWTEALADTVDDLLVNASSLPAEADGIHERLMQAFERTLILRALHHTGGRRIEAAQLLGIGRNTITRKIQELKLDEEHSAKSAHVTDHTN